MADYISVADFRTMASIPSGHTTEIQFAVTGASRAVERYCSRVFVTSTGSRDYAACESRRLEIDDVSSPSGFTVSTDDGAGTFATTWVSTDYQLRPLNGLRDGQPWPYNELHGINQTFPISLYGAANVRISATWGWPSVPAEVTSGVFILAQDIYKSKDAPFGVAGTSEFGVLRIRENAQLKMLLQEFRKHSAFVG